MKLVNCQYLQPNLRRRCSVKKVPVAFSVDTNKLQPTEKGYKRFGFQEQRALYFNDRLGCAS